MWITRLELRNIKSYDENGQVIEFRPGVNLIRGENGAGKSTMLEAIGFALFDSALYHQERFVREGAGKGQIVVGFVSARDEREYQVVRGVRGGQIYIYDPELNLQVCDGKKDVLDFIFSHLSVEPGTKLGALFQDAIGVPQGTMTAVFLEDSTDRKKQVQSPVARRRVRGGLCAVARDGAVYRRPYIPKQQQPRPPGRGTR